MKPIILPSNYSSTIQDENDIISQINDRLYDLETLANLDRKPIYSEYVQDFESYEMDIYFSNSQKKATIGVFDDIVSITINGNTVRVDQNGNVIQ